MGLDSVVCSVLMLFLGEKKREEGYKEHVFSGKKATKQSSVDTGEGRRSQTLNHSPTNLYLFSLSSFVI